MMIFAMFLCIASTGQCNAVEGGRASPSFGYISGIYYTSRAECERRLPHSPARGLTYRCMAKRVETWR